MIRKAAATVRCPGVNMAPISKVWACSQMRLENSLAKLVRIVVYSLGKVSRGLLLGGMMLKLTLYFVNVQMDKV
jgi:hypothetical protein